MVCDLYLKPYLGRIQKDGLLRLGPKQIHDAVWGTISLRPLEVALLDSPLLQRLRHLRQLGVVHWVYPGADHSRFEHSLGVLFQVQELISALNRSGMTKYGVSVVSDNDIQMLRVAALMHDVGHPVLSHVSEYGLRLDPKILLEIQRDKRAVGEKVSVSELIAAKIVQSPTFNDLLQIIGNEHTKAGLPVTDWVTNTSGFTDRVSKTILGQNVSSDVPLLHELVSGPYDADKLDYMVRDALAAGIPATVDISRLVQKLMVVKTPTSDLPQAIGRLVPQGKQDTYLFGFPWSGLSIVDDLLLGRLMLYAKLYRHPKVAGLEAIVQSLLDQIHDLVGAERAVRFIYSVLDDQLILAGRDELMSRLELKSEDIEAPNKAASFEVALDLLRRLRERRLFVRAFAFFPGQPEVDDDKVSQTFDHIIKHIDDQSNRDALVTKVIAEARTILQHLGMPPENYLYRNADKLIVMRRLEAPSQKELRHAWIFPTGGPPKTVEKTSIHREAWSSSFLSASAKAYIFAPKELAQAAYLGTEAIIAKEFGVGIPEWMMEETKLSAGLLSEPKLKLRSAGYYRDKPKIIRPRRPRMNMTDVENVIAGFASRFSAVQETVAGAFEYDGPSAGMAALKSRAYTWLDQLDTDRDIECGMVLLQRARLIGRTDVVNAVKDFLTKHPDFSNASVISLNKGNDSSQIVQYFAADVGGDLIFYGSLEDASHAETDAPVIIVDDFCASGNQWVNLIGALFQDAELQRDLNEQRSLALEPEQEFLRSRKVAFVFTAGWTNGRDAIERAAQKVGMDARVHVHLTEDDLPFAEDVLNESESREHAPAFLEKVKSVGEALLEQNEPNWDRKKIASRALGYGNRGMLLFFPYNAPSQTLTCMWAEGEIDGERWDALIRRRK
jgi:hypothetical protein